MEHGRLLDKLFTTPVERRLLNGYRNIFNIREIEDSRILQLAIGVLLLSFFLGFSRWFYSYAISVSSYVDNTYVCWPYFQGCGKWYFLQALPQGYSQSIMFMGLYGIMTLVAYFMYKREWTLAHALLILVWIAKVLILFVLTEQLAANYDYYDVLIMFVILFLPYKLFFSRLIFMLLYFLAATIKIHEGWILGSYFTALQTGLPIFGNAVAPLVTNLVIFMQIIGCWFLFSRNWYLQRGALVYFMIFHLYSGILVGYRYPTIAFLMLIVLFAISTHETWTAIPLNRRALVGWYFVALLFIAQFTPIVIPGDQKLTLEGNYYGLFMFEANHQCISRATAYYANGTTKPFVRQSYDSTWRCDPYEFWFAFHNMCERDTAITRIAWTFDHSINGGPFYRIVDQSDACTLSYSAFSHNEWIHTPSEGTVQIVGYPRQNYFQ